MIIGYFLNVAIGFWIIIQCSNNTIAITITYKTPVLFKNNRKQSSCLCSFPTARIRRSNIIRQQHWEWEPIAGVFVKKWHWHYLVYYPNRQKVVSHDASCIQVQRKQTAVQTQHLNLTTKILSTSTIKLRMAAVTPYPFVLLKTINVENERNLDFRN